MIEEVRAQIGERELGLWADLWDGLLKACEATGIECHDDEPLATAVTGGGRVTVTAGLVREMRAKRAKVCGWCKHPASIGPCPKWVTRDGVPDPCDCDDPCHVVTIERLR